MVGKEGKLNQRAQVPAAGGEWAVIADSVNSLVSDLVQPTNEISRVIGAVAQRRSVADDGHRVRWTSAEGRVPPHGEDRQHDGRRSSASFASEVTRVAREVGTEGKLGGQADVKGVAGTWKDLTESVNSMAGNLTGAGAQHRRSHDGRRERRSLQEDHRRSARRDPRTEEHDQHDGRSAPLVRLGSHARCARSRQRREARRSGGRAGRFAARGAI